MDSTRAYADLPEEWKQRLCGLRGHFTYFKATDFIPGVPAEDQEACKKGGEHPLVIAHPESGLKNIYANQGFCIKVLGLSTQESDEILDFLFQHLNQPKYYHAHVWKEDDMGMWDNFGKCVFVSVSECL